MAYWINERPYGKTVSKTDCMSANVPMIPIYILNVTSCISYEGFSRAVVNIKYSK